MFDSTTLAGKRALVTGASSGLGAHFAALLAAHGAQVVLAARRIDSLEAMATSIAQKGSVSCLQLDVRDTASHERAIESAGPIDILVNNAGVVREGSAMTQSEEDWDSVMETNLKGAFFLSQAVAKDMQKRGGGSIVNVASILGLRQAGGVIAYAVSKAGIVQLTKTLALEWARHGIRVNALAPGYIETDLNRDFWSGDAGKSLIKRIPSRRLGRLDDLNGPMLLLASDLSQYMTGSVLAVDGGHLVSTL